MGPRPSPAHSIERRDNNGDYEPGNCEWATWAEQGQNRRGLRLITVGGITKTFGKWAESAGISNQTLYERIAKGWPLERAVTVGPTPRRKRMGLGMNLRSSR
jgi:hypothetical protein